MKPLKELDFQEVYHALSEQYGQSMTMREVCVELKVRTPEAARQRIPRGWIGSGKGLRMRTVNFARQFVELV